MRPGEVADNSGEKLPHLAWKRLGVAGFTFFLLKGLLWLVLPALVIYLG